MADNENYIENIQFGEDEEIYPIRDAEAVEKDGGELADTIVTYDNEATTVSSFTDFISNFVSGSRIAKWFKDFRAGVEYILHVGSLVNNCVTDNAQLPLSAAQGKVLMDELTSVKSDLTELDTDLTEGTGWITLELADGVSAATNTTRRTPAYCKIGNWVHVVGGVSFTYAGSVITIATLPEGFRPERDVVIPEIATGNYICRMAVSYSSGAITFNWIFNTSDGTLVTSSNVSWAAIDVLFPVP